MECTKHCSRGGLADAYYLKAYDSIRESRESLGDYFAFYNTERRHQSLDRRTPDSVYYESAVRLAA